MKVIEETGNINSDDKTIRKQLSESTITIQLTGLEAALIYCLTGSVSGLPDKSIRGEADAIRRGLRQFLIRRGVDATGTWCYELLCLTRGSLSASNLPEREWCCA